MFYFKFSFRAHPKNFVIESASVAISWERTDKHLRLISFVFLHLYKSCAFETLNRIAPSFRSAPVFLPPLV